MLICLFCSGEGLPYELLQKAEVEESKTATPTSSRAISVSHSETGSSSIAPTTPESLLTTSEGATTLASSLKSKSASPDKNLALRALRETSPLAVKSMYTLNKPPPDVITESEAFINTLVSPRIHCTKEGKVTFTDLFFPPPFLPLIQPDSTTASDIPTPSEEEQEMKKKAAELQARKSPHLSPLHSTSQRLPAKRRDGKPRSPVKSAKTRSPRTPPSPQKSPSKARKKEVDKSPPRKSPERKLSRKEELLQPKRDRHCWLGRQCMYSV